MSFLAIKNQKQLWIVIITILLVLAIIFRWTNHNWEHIIDSDGRGYYFYLPAILKYHDLSFKYCFNGELILPQDYTSNFLFIIDGHYVIKYPVGVAILLTPFYFVATMFSLIGGFDTNGFSFFYQIMVSVAAIFYAAIGGKYLLKIMLFYGVEFYNAAILLLLLFLGTNLTYYIVDSPSMSHVYSFSMVSVFLWQIQQFVIRNKGGHLIKAAIALGIIVLIRPVNGIIIFAIPVLFMNSSHFGLFFKNIFGYWKYLLAGLLVFLSIIFIQPILWKLQNGNWYVWTYMGESFKWESPAISKVLFSYRKGWFIYTPAMLLLIPSLAADLFSKRLLRFLLVLFFWIVVIYIISSWWCWYYGGSFGQRAFIEFYAVAILSISLFYSKIRNTKIFTFVNIFIVFCIGLNLIQSYQMEKNIMHYDSMDKEKYWKIFLKTGKENQWMVYVNPRKNPPEEIKNKIIYSSFNDFESSSLGWENNRVDDVSDSALSGNHVIKMDSIHGSSLNYKISIDSFPQSTIHITVTGWFYNGKKVPSQSKILIMLDQKDSSLFKQEIPLNNIKIIKQENNWSEFRVDGNVQYARNNKPQLNVFFSNKSDKEQWLDDITVYVY